MRGARVHARRATRVAGGGYSWSLWTGLGKDAQLMSPDLLDRHRILRLLLVLLIFVLGIILLRLTWSILVTLGDVILLFFLGWIIAFILEPVSLLLQKRGLKRVFAVSLIYVALLVVVSGIIVLTVPSIKDEVQLLASEITAALSPGNLTNLNNSFVSMLRHIGFSKQNAHSIVNTISDQIPQMALSLTSGAVNTTTRFFAQILGILFDTFLVMIISFYMMLDGDRLVESFVRRLPPAWISDVRLFQNYVEQIFGGFFRAQLTIGLIYGILTWVILMFFQQANGLLVGVVSGIIMLLPFIGPPLSIIPPVLLVLLHAHCQCRLESAATRHRPRHRAAGRHAGSRATHIRLADGYPPLAALRGPADRGQARGSLGRFLRGSHYRGRPRNGTSIL